jgi:hypothetical protein
MTLAPRATTFSANKWTFNFATFPIESGRGPDTVLEFVQQEDDFGYVEAVDGEGCFYENGKRYALATLTLMQTSAGNAVLGAIHIASKAAGGLPAPLFIEDRIGTEKIVSEAALIMKTPDLTVAREPGTRLWVVGVHSPKWIVGGH